MAAAQRRLAGIQGLSVELQDKLRLRGFHTALDLFKRSDSELIEMLNAPLEDVQQLMLHVATALVRPRTALSLAQSESALRRLTVGDESHKSLRIIRGVTELAGSAGLGKTQACLMLAASALAEQDGSVIYIDTESTFSQSRLVNCDLTLT